VVLTWNVRLLTPSYKPSHGLAGSSLGTRFQNHLVPSKNLKPGSERFATLLVGVGRSSSSSSSAEAPVQWSDRLASRRAPPSERHARFGCWSDSIRAAAWWTRARRSCRPSGRTLSEELRLGTDCASQRTERIARHTTARAAQPIRTACPPPAVLLPARSLARIPVIRDAASAPRRLHRKAGMARSARVPGCYACASRVKRDRSTICFQRAAADEVEMSSACMPFLVPLLSTSSSSASSRSRRAA
jgi:hypothetical protein